LTAAKID